MLANWKLRLIASDISGKVLARACEGRYNQFEVNRGLPETLRAKYFQQVSDEWLLKEDIRQMVEFRQINLIKSWPSLPAMDIIFLRNVLINFDVEMKKAVLDQVQKLLKPDGYLFLGGGETTLYLHDSFELVQYNNTVCYRVRNS